MIEVYFAAPCKWDSSVMGMAVAEIAYTGEDPVKTARRYLAQIPRAILAAVFKDGTVHFNRL